MIDDVTAGLLAVFSNGLRSITEGNALKIAEDIQAMKIETNLSDNYRRDVIGLLCTFSKFHGTDKKEFKDIAREDIISFLESYRTCLKAKAMS
jgi:hypothetical protein